MNYINTTETFVAQDVPRKKQQSQIQRKSNIYKAKACTTKQPKYTKEISLCL